MAQRNRVGSNQNFLHQQSQNLLSHGNFSPAVFDKAVKATRAEIRHWNLHLRSDKSIEDLSRMFNPKIRGWLQLQSELPHTLLQIRQGLFGFFPVPES